MKKTLKIIFGTISLLILGGFTLYIFTNEFKRTVKVGECEGIYYKKIFEKPKPGFLDLSESNAKNDVALCLCEKYIVNKNAKYKTEIFKLYNEAGLRYSKFEKPKQNIDSICKYRNEIFFKMYDM